MKGILFILIQCCLVCSNLVIQRAFGYEVELLTRARAGYRIDEHSNWSKRVKKIKFTNIYRIWVEEEDLKKAKDLLTQNRNILFVEEAGLLKAQSIDNTAEWKNLNSLKELERLSDGRGSLVAVLDTGLDLRNQKFAKQLWINEDEVANDGIDNDNNGYVDDLFGLNTGGLNIQDITDVNGHGTKVSSIILSIAPECQILCIKVNQIQTEYFSIGAIVEGIYYALQVGADVLNMSFSGRVGSYAMEQALKHAKEAGCVLVGAAGNSNQKAVEFPASLSKVLAVGAMDLSGNICNNSAFGPELDILALGHGVPSTDLESTQTLGYGTSFSTAIVSGTAAVLLSMNPNLKEGTVKSIICNKNTLFEQENFLQDQNVSVLNGTKICKAVTSRALFPQGEEDLLDLFFPLNVDIFLPPTDQESKLYIIAEEHGEYWWLGGEGKWHDSSEKRLKSLFTLPAYSQGLTCTLFGEEGIFPSIPNQPFSLDRADWYVLLTDKQGRLLTSFD